MCAAVLLWPYLFVVLDVGFEHLLWSSIGYAVELNHLVQVAGFALGAEDVD